MVREKEPLGQVAVEEPALGQEGEDQAKGVYAVQVSLEGASLPQLLAFVELLRAKVRELGGYALNASFSLDAELEFGRPEAPELMKAWGKELADPLGADLGVSVRRRP
jgi:hypothetical protein